MQVTYYQFMVYPTQIKNTEMFAFVAVPVFRKV